MKTLTHRRIRTHRVVDAVEAAYRLEGTHEGWLASLLEAVHPDLDLGAGLYTFSARVSATRFAPDSAFTSRALDPRFIALLARLNEDPPGELLEELAKSLVHAGGLEELIGPDHPVTRHFRATAKGTGFVDGFTLFAQDGEGRGVCLSAPARASVNHGEPARAAWRRVGLHFAAGLRLRAKLAAGPMRPEALVAPGGKIADAEGPLRRDPGLRAKLQAAVASMEKARTRALRGDPERALRLWKGLMGGRWSLVDRWEADGRRYVAAHANAPALRDFRALTKQEGLLLRYVSLGASNKEVAFALGLPMGTVATTLRRVVRKLGGRSRRDLVGLDQAEHLRVDLGGDRLDVLRLQRARDAKEVTELTAAEREVLERLAGGASNAAIAAARGSSVKTVTHQVESVFRKLGVQSRTEAMAKVLAKGDEG